jgi:hypothetical protein
MQAYDVLKVKNASLKSVCYVRECIILSFYLDGDYQQLSWSLRVFCAWSNQQLISIGYGLTSTHPFPQTLSQTLKCLGYGKESFQQNMLTIVGSVKVSALISSAHPQWLNQPVYRRVLFCSSKCPAGERQLQIPESAIGYR